MNANLGNVLIFGDSYSTFFNYIPDGYRHYYGGERCDTNLRFVEQTWWYKLIKETKSNLILNDSWSGSTVCNTGYNNSDCSKTSSFVYRLSKYIDNGFFNDNKIDTVFIFGGTNDSWANSPLGELKFSDWSEEDLYCFLPAICYFIDKLKQILPQSRIFCLVNLNLKKEFIDGMLGAAEKYGVKAIGIGGFDTMCNHPTVQGMEQIKNLILERIES